jgi:hypothetical protein
MLLAGQLVQPMKKQGANWDDSDKKRRAGHEFT